VRWFEIDPCWQVMRVLVWTGVIQTREQAWQLAHERA
jgi:hypothetical protein